VCVCVCVCACINTCNIVILNNTIEGFHSGFMNLRLCDFLLFVLTETPVYICRNFHQSWVLQKNTCSSDVTFSSWC
jgi:hypothetical protein